MEDIRQNLGLEPDCKTRDEEIRRMPVGKQFECFLTWNGIIGYSDRILDVVEDLLAGKGFQAMDIHDMTFFHKEVD
jgi:hypothetical protein